MARILEKVIGHCLLLKRIDKMLADARMPTASIFVGVHGIGKKLVAQSVAQALICDRRGQEGESISGSACGNCPACLRVASGQSENLLLVEPDGTQIKIEQSRRIINFISLRSSGRARVIIINDAQTLNMQAANALLKSLEEPPDNTFFILIVPSLGAVLPTVRSRCQVFRFGALTMPEIKRISGADDWIVANSQGSLVVVEQLASSGNDLRLAAIHFLHALLVERKDNIEESVRQLVRERSTAMPFIRYLSAFVRDALLVHYRADGCINADQSEFIGAIAQMPPDELLALAGHLQEVETGISQNFDRVLMLENLVFRMVEKNTLNNDLEIKL